MHGDVPDQERIVRGGYFDRLSISPAIDRREIRRLHKFADVSGA